MLPIQYARTRLLAAALLAAAAMAGLAACQREAAPATSGAALEPAQAVLQLADDLRRNDLAGYARHALPPALHERMATAWREGRTIWPLTELPLDDRLPGFITVLAAPNAEKELLATYNHQFAGADRELRSAAATLSLFAAQYVDNAPDYGPAERAHYGQLIHALGRWGQQAPLGDPARARVAIPGLVAAARLTGLAGPGPNERAATFHRLGMERSLQRLGPFMERFKQMLAAYGLDVDAALAGLRAETVARDGDHARVRLRYTLAGAAIDTVVPVERHDGRWYLSDLLRHARTQAASGLQARGPGPAAPPRAVAKG